MFGIRFKDRIFGIPARRYYFLHAGVMFIMGCLFGFIFSLEPIIGAMAAGFAGWALATYNFLRIGLER